MSLNVTVQLDLTPFKSKKFRIIDQKHDRFKALDNDLFKCDYGRIRLVRRPEFRVEDDNITFYLRGEGQDHKQIEWCPLFSSRQINTVKALIRLVNAYNQQPEEAGWIKVEAEGLEVWQSP